VPTRLELAIEMDRRVAARAGRQTREIPEGVAILDAELSGVFSLNLVAIRAGACSGLNAAGLIELSERWLGHLRHRSLRLEDPDVAESLADEMREAGYQRERTVLMATTSPELDAAPDARARPLSEEELDAVMLADFKQTDYGPNYFEGLPEMLVAAQARLRGMTPAQGFGAGEHGGIQSTCTLFRDDDVLGQRVAMIDQVVTLSAYRERGLAKAALRLALAAAMGWHPDLIVIPADADDWPQIIYSKLGFAPVGTVVGFLRAPA
jgi:hypothetical protein